MVVNGVVSSNPIVDPPKTPPGGKRSRVKFPPSYQTVPIDAKVEHAWTTSTFVQMVWDQTSEVSGRGKVGYNPDVDIPQNPALRYNLNILHPASREVLYRFSTFLRTHTEDLIREIVDRGWVYAKKGTNLRNKMEQFQRVGFMDDGALERPFENQENLAQIEAEWDYALNNAFIDAVSKALVIDCAYLTRFNANAGQTDANGKELLPDPLYKVFTHNDEYRIYGDQARRIMEVYLQFPRYAEMYNYWSGQNSLGVGYVGYLTQHAPMQTAPGRIAVDNLNPEITKKINGVPETVTRDCVVIIPQGDPHDPHGWPFLMREVQTALEKICLRNYEFCILDNGGVKKTLAVPDSMSDDAKDNLVREIKRGIRSHGTVLEINGGSPEDLVMVAETPIPTLPLNDINSHLSEDALLSKQGIEGAAQTGALGGIAPKENAIVDETVLRNLQPLLEQVIKDINFVFFGQDPKGYEVFFKPRSSNTIGQNAKNISSNPSADDEASATEADPSPEIAAHGVKGQFYEAEQLAHSVTDEFVSFTGNMFQAGVYFYPEHKKTRIFTPEEIKAYTDKDKAGRTGYLEIDHSGDPVVVGIQEGIGWYETTGYDPIKRADITQFHLKKRVWDALGCPKRIKTSPFFHLVEKPDRPKEFFVQNCAVVCHGKPRSELSGLDTTATIQGDHRA